MKLNDIRTLKWAIGSICLAAVFVEPVYALEDKLLKDYRQSLLLISKQDFHKAEGLLQKILQQSPRHLASRSELAYLYLNHGKLDEAKNLLDEGLKLDANHKDFLRLLAMVYNKKGDHNNALSMAEKMRGDRVPVKTFDPTFSGKAIAPKPESHFIKKSLDPNVLFERREVDTDTEHKSPSVESEENDKPLFSKSRPSFSDEEEALYDFRRALVHINRRQDKEAELLLTAVIERLPTHHAARTELATLFYNRGDFEQTEEIVTEGLKLDESHPDFLRLMAMVHDIRGEPDRALSLLVRVKDSGKQDKNYIAFLGYIYQQTGQFSLARQQYFRLLQVEPNNSNWLLGVTVALDSEGQREAALEGYQRITKQGGIDANIIKYAEERISALKG